MCETFAVTPVLHSKNTVFSLNLSATVSYVELRQSCLNTFVAISLKKTIVQCQAFLQKSLHFMVLNLNDYVLVTCQWILMKFSVNDTQKQILFII